MFIRKKHYEEDLSTSRRVGEAQGRAEVVGRIYKHANKNKTYNSFVESHHQLDLIKSRLDKLEKLENFLENICQIDPSIRKRFFVPSLKTPGSCQLGGGQISRPLRNI